MPDTCDWINAAGHDAGIYTVEGRYGAVEGVHVEINKRAQDEDERISLNTTTRRNVLKGLSAFR